MGEVSGGGLGGWLGVALTGCVTATGSGGVVSATAGAAPPNTAATSAAIVASNGNVRRIADLQDENGKTRDVMGARGGEERGRYGLAMTRLLLIRHAKPAANWDVSDDAGLDPTGRGPLAGRRAGRRARPARSASDRDVTVAAHPETAAPLADAWSMEPVVDPTVGEIASPGVTMEERSSWLRVVMAAQWADLDESLQSWRESLLATLVALPTDTVVVTHFVAINTVVGACTGDERVLSFSPTHTSITEIEVVDGALASRRARRRGEQPS